MANVSERCTLQSTREGGGIRKRSLSSESEAAEPSDGGELGDGASASTDCWADGSAGATAVCEAGEAPGPKAPKVEETGETARATEVRAAFAQREGSDNSGSNGRLGTADFFLSPQALQRTTSLLVGSRRHFGVSVTPHMPHLFVEGNDWLGTCS